MINVQSVKIAPVLHRSPGFYINHFKFNLSFNVVVEFELVPDLTST